ncbi:hypothetical protein ABK040_016591 [Willaertia magna]
MNDDDYLRIDTKKLIENDANIKLFGDDFLSPRIIKEKPANSIQNENESIVEAVVDNENELRLNIRRVERKDFATLNTFLNENSFILTKRYGNYNLKTVVETSYIGLIAEIGQQIVGFAAFEFYPPFEDLPYDHHFPEVELNTSNNIWIRLMHYEPFYGDVIMKEMMSTILITFPEIDYMCFQPPSATTSFGHLLEFNGFQHYHKVDETKNEEINLVVCHRNSLGRGIEKLTIRQAAVEDNDDIIPLLSFCQNLTVMKADGEYFFANLLHNQDDDHKILLATDNNSGEVIGVMYITVVEDIENLIDNFKLGIEIPVYDELIEEKIIESEDGTTENEIVYVTNAFEIKLFYILDEFKHRSIDFLREAFKYFPQYKYCTIGIPFLDFEKSEHPLLKQFIYIEPAQECTTENSLHILPKVSLFADFFVVKASEAALDKNSSSEETIIQLLGQADFQEDFINAVSKSFSGNRFVTMLLFDKNSAFGGQNEILGIIVLDTQINEYLLRRHFEFSEYIDYSAYPSRGHCQAMITHFYIEQKFFRHSKLFLKEVMKKLDKHILYYGVFKGIVPNESLNKEMICLKSTRQIEFPEVRRRNISQGSFSQLDVESVKSESTVSHYSSASSRITATPFDSLYFINRRYMSEDKTEIHTRIVVIGASKTGLSFIKALSMFSSLYFSNIVVISPEDDVTKSGEYYADDTDEDFNNKELTSMINLPNIFFIKDKLEDIDRHNRKVILSYNTSTFTTYDRLILCTSRQYKMKQKFLELPSYPKKGVVNLNSRMILETGEEVELSDVLSSFINTTINKYRDDNMSCIMIYGTSLDAFCTARTLINRFRVSPSKILMVFPEGKKSIFNDNEDIETKLEQILEKLGVRHYRFYSLEDFGCDENGNMIKVFLVHNKNSTEDGGKKNTKLLEVPCTLLINCHTKDVDDGILSTVNRQSLVFDGRLIVDTHFRTTDPNIFSAGPMAKFSRRFGESKMMEAFNSSEVGAKLAHSVLHTLGVNLEEEYIPNKIPQFTKNGSVRCVLPGEVKFFRTMTISFDPEQCIKLTTDYLLPNQQFQLDEEIIVKKFRYTSIYVNKQTNNIECICYLGQENIEEGNLASLVGLPVSYFKDLTLRYKEGLIEDFISFFRENWIMAILSHKFLSFKNDLKKRLLDASTPFHQQSRETEKIGNINYVADEIADLIMRGETTKLTDDPSLFVELDKQINSESKVFIQSELIDFLQIHQEILHSIPSVYIVPRK